MSAIDKGNETLKVARRYHKHFRVIVGGNFVECLECGKHAHLDTDPTLLVVHGRAGEPFYYAAPEEF